MNISEKMQEYPDEDRHLLHNKLKFWRAERPDEWTMDEFIRDAKTMHDEIAKLKQECDELAAQVEVMRDALTKCKFDSLNMTLAELDFCRKAVSITPSAALREIEARALESEAQAMMADIDRQWLNMRAASNQVERIAELERKVAAYQAVSKIIDLELRESCEGLELRGGDYRELNILLAQAREEGRKGAIPDAWVAIPREPSDNMLIALLRNFASTSSNTMLDNYRAMLAAAPKP